ncbi:MAG: hydroxymethylglutaryl-CoA synthase [Deltaproteobacteria bacterium]|nr:hydroxymethylglutaryl-CoA synthase [Deltaproteobacteria bacterium]
MQTHPRIGIKAISVYIPRHFLSLDTLAVVTGVDPAKYHLGLGIRRMAVAAPNEDPVTMAAAAAHDLFARYDIDAATVGLLVVGSESGVDAAKPIASFVHGMLGLSPDCRTFDTTHACYGGTAALRLASDWHAVRGTRTGKVALVIATDVARYPVGSAAEPTQGAGAVAMVVGGDPEVMELDPFPEAVYTKDVMDFWRPHYRREAIVDGQVSIDCYLRALGHTWAAYEQSSGLCWDDYDYLLFHVPFPKMAYKAFHMLHQREVLVRGASGAGLASLEDAFIARTQPALWVNAEVGNIYSGSLYLSLASLLEAGGPGVQGSRAGLFSYGSGCCGEFFSGRLGPRSTAWEGKIGAREAMESRIELDYEQYLEFRRAGARMTLDGSFAAGVARPVPGRFSFDGIRDHQRVYTTAQEDLGRDWAASDARASSAKAQIGK